MNYMICPLTTQDEPIVWDMLRYAAHESSLESVQQQPELARYAAGWGRVGDCGYGAWQGTTPIGAAWMRLWSGDDKGFGYISDGIPELGLAVIPDYRGQGIGTRLLTQLLDTAKGKFRCPRVTCLTELVAYRSIWFISSHHSVQIWESRPCHT